MELEDLAARDGPRTDRRSRRKPDGSGIMLRDSIVHSYCRGMSADWETNQKLQLTNETAFPVGATVFRSYALAPIAGQMAEAADILSTHDQYRVKLVEVDFIFDGGSYSTPLPTYPTPGARTEAWSYVPMLYVAYDGDTVTSFSRDEMRQRSSTKCILLRPGKKITISYKPKVLQSLEGGTGLTMVTSPRLNCAVTNVEHRGLLYGVAYPNPSGSYGNTTAGTLFVQARLYVDGYGQR